METLERPIETLPANTLQQYRQWIRQILAELAKRKPSYGDLDRFTIFDSESDRYQVATVGWDGDLRVFACLVHIDIQDGKIWIQYDGTEVGVANELIELGVPKKAIVLGFHDPDGRAWTGFATG